MVQLLCVLTCTGMPLHTRVCAGVAPPTFPTLGLLSAVFLSSGKHTHTLNRLSSTDAHVVFRAYDDTILLVLVTSRLTTTEDEMLYLLDRVRDALVLSIGQHELFQTSGTNMERLKRMLRAANPLVDSILSEPPPLSMLANAPEVMLLGQQSQYLQCLRQLSQKIAVQHCAFVIQGKVPAASPAWWDLDSRDLAVVLLYVSVLPKAAARDIPVYLPHTQPTTPFRLMTCAITSGVEVVILAGPQPPLDVLMDAVRDTCAKANVAFAALARPLSMRSNYSIPLDLDRGVWGIIFAHENNRMFSTFNPFSQNIFGADQRTPPTTPSHDSHHPFDASFDEQTASASAVDLTLPYETRRNILSAFFSTTNQLLHPPKGHPELSLLSARSSYMCAKLYTLVALQEDKHDIFLLLAPTLSRQACMDIAQETLRLLVGLVR
eukprot:TRINITY_DN10418_c0_g1_i1.p1 TRINITY_DN10418_c0_g1~~TRINITY_DN10418_c0_g1_i1.p1  ORF type:complete len:434 (+),score=74.02 TRINITY_DN10418_c0_g1_i1:30-1331(+)